MPKILSIEERSNGLAYARLHEEGKIDIVQLIPDEEMLKFFNALKNVIEAAK